MLFCSFGPGSASVSRLFSFSFADASNTIQTGKCGRNHSLSGRGSNVGTTLGRVVRKPVNANPGLKVNPSINFSC